MAELARAQARTQANLDQLSKESAARAKETAAAQARTRAHLELLSAEVRATSDAVRAASTTVEATSAAVRRVSPETAGLFVFGLGSGLLEVLNTPGFAPRRF